MADRIKVGVKVRPLIKREKTDRAHIHWEAVSDTQIVQVDPVSGRQKNEPFTFDRVFGPSSSNQEVFEVLVKPIVESAVKGFNGTIFAYGQTASGKTYTMMGDQFEPGIIPQAVSLIFNSIENSQGREFLLRVCYMEIYNEKINDLLLKSNRNLKVTEDNLGNVIVKDLEETITSSAQMVMDLMKKGETIRKIGVTNMNERSSRSHSIFRVIIESRNTASDADEAIQVSHLNLVDLAGSERAGATGCVGDQFKEGCAINTSLFTLGKVIAQLSEGEATFVNFRDSKLTRILQSSLGGNALTAIICAVTPAALEETNSTLGFASRARNIKVSATVNEVLTDSALLKRYLRQIDRLNGAISALQEEKSAETENLQKENLLLQERISRLKDCLVVSGSEDTSEKAKSLKKLRRRTWSAPNRNVARLSLAFPKKPIHSLSNIKEEIPCLGVTLAGSMEFDEDAEDVFSTPLEEFEKALMKAERAKSMDGTDWTPSVDTFDDEDTLEDHVPPISYVQTRKPRCHVIKESFDPVTETPPSKLRAKMHIVEKELDELNEYTRLEKQVYNEELNAELDRVKAQLVESNSKCESLKTELSETREQLTSLQCVQEQMDKLKLSDRTSHDYQMLLIDSAKEQAQLRDRNKEIEQQLSDAIERCQGFAKLEEELAATTKLLEENCKGNAGLKERLKKQEGELRLLLNEKQDFDIQFSIQKSKYESRLKDLSQALEDARFELSQVQLPTQHKTYAGMGDLYSLEEEPAIDDLLNELAAKQLKISELERQLLTLKSSSVSTQQIEAPVFENDYLSEIRTLKEDNSAMIKEIEEKNGTLSEFVTELSKLQKELENSRNCTGEELKDELESEKKHLEEELTAAKNLLLEQLQELGVDEHVSLPHAISQFLLCLKSTNERCAEVEIRAQGLVHELSETKSMLSDLGTELHEREQQLQETAYEVDVLREQLQKQEKMNPCNLEQDQNEQLVLINAKLEIEKKTARDLRENLEDREKLLSETVTKLEDLRELSELQKSESANKIAQLMNELETIKQTNTDLMKDLERSKDLTNKTTAQMEELQEQLCELQKCSQQSAEQHLEELARIRTELEGEQNAKESLQEDLVRKEQLILQADMDMKQLREQLSGLPNSEILTNEIMRIKSELVAVKELNEGLRNDLQSKESLLSASATEIRQLREQLSELQCSEKSNNIISEELNSYKKKLFDLDNDLHHARALISAAVTDINCDESILFASLITQVLSRLSSATEMNKELENKNRTCQSQLEHLIQVSTEEFEGLKSNNDDLKAKLELTEASLNRISCDNEQLKDQLKDLQEMSSSIIQEIPPSQCDVEQLTNKIAELEDDVLKARSLCASIDGINADENISLASLLQQVIEVYKKFESEKQVALKHLQEVIGEHSEELVLVTNRLESEKVVNEGLRNQLNHQEACNAKHVVEIGHLEDKIKLSTQSVNPNPSDLEQLDISHKKSLMIEEDLEKVRSMLDTDARNESVPLSTLLTQFLDRLQSAEDRSSEFEHRHHVLSDELITVKSDLGAKASLLSQLSLNGSCIKCMTITDQPEQLIQVKHVANSLHGQGGTSDLERCEVTSAETHELCDDTENLKSVIKDLTNQLKLKDNAIVKAATEMEQLRDQIRKLESMDKIREPCTPEKSIRCDSDVEVEETHSIRSSSEGEVESLSTTRKALLHELDAKDSLIEEIEDERRQLREKVRDLSNRQADVKEPGEGNCSISDTDVLKAQLNALKEELKSKDEIILGVQKELQQIRQDCSKLNAVLVADDVCQKCIILEEEKISFEKEIEFARNALLSEIKAISADSDIVDNTLASLVSQLLSSVMQAQAQVASIHQQNVDERTEKLQDCLHREKEHIETIKNLRMQLNEFAVGKKSLESALEALQSKCDESVEQQTQLKRNLEVTIESASKTAENLKLEEEECLKLKKEIVNLRNSVLSIRAELDNKVEGIEKLEQERARLKVMLQEKSDKAQHAEKLEQELSELKLTLKENSKLIASKQALQSKVTSLYNDVVVNKELISKLETSIANDKLQLNEKEEIITSLNKRVEELEKEKNLLQADVTRVKAELDLLVKSTSTPSDEIAELKVEKEFLEKQYQNALKSSRETKTQNRKLHVELGKLRKDIEEGKLSSRSQDVSGLASTIEEKGETIKKLELECKEKADKISELEEEKLHLDKECDELLSWGRSMEASNIELAERLVNVLKDLAGSKSQLFSTVSENIFTLRKLSRVIVTSLSKVDSEQMEMQLTSKEKAARNSKTRVEKIKSQMQVIDCDRLQGLCAELHKENLLICNLLEETSNVFHKMMENAKHPSPLKECSSCTELQKWGLEQEARALALSEQVDRLEGRLKVRDENIVSHSTRSRAKRESADEQLSNGHNCECQELIKSQREKLADKNAEITVLKLKQQIQNKPAEDMIKKQEEKLKLLREEVKSLKAQNRRLLSSYQDTTVCGQEVKMKSIQTQTLESADQIYKSQYWPSGPSGIVEEANRTTLEARVKKLEREKETYKALCVNRKERCDVLEKRVKELIKENQENEPHYTLRSRRNN